MAPAKSWLPELALRFRFDSVEKKPSKSTLGILAFETAKTMSRLLSLYRTLSDDDFATFRRTVIRSKGVRLLNSRDEPFLLHLACNEKIDDLDRFAAAVFSLAARCRDPRLQAFGRMYADMKLGFYYIERFAFPETEIGRRISKMEGFISATADLYTGLEVLADMELTEKKMAQWKTYAGMAQSQKPNSDLFEQRLAWHRRKVRRVRQASLWSQSFDKTVTLMARFVCNIFARICVVFGPYFSDLPIVMLDRNYVSLTCQMLPRSYSTSSAFHRSAPQARTMVKDMTGLKSSSVARRSFFRVFRSEKMQKSAPAETEKGRGEFRRRERTPEAAGTTLGAAALAMRYANVIVMAEKMARYPEVVEEEMRADLYEMLPWRLRMAVKRRMRGKGKAAEGRMEEVEEILEWIAPMAHDMIRWQVERTFVLKQQDFEPRPSVMLLQTLYYSDREKAEAAIVELMVGLSCNFRQESRRQGLPFAMGW